MNRNYLVAAAVTAVLASGAASAQVSLATIQATPRSNTVYIAGSSAIKAALLATIQNNFCGGTFTNITSSGNNKNFLGVACTPNPALVSNPGGNYNVWLRYEGGSVAGYLPIVNNVGINFISAAALTNLTPSINGEATTNGTNDSFTGPLADAIPDLAIGDVEPQALIGNNYPAAYSTAVWGPNNQTGMFNLKSSGGIIDEVYALYVNQVGTVITEQPLNLTSETIAQILTGTIKNWSQVFDTAGNPVATGALAITVVNREQGSGSRAATDILLAGDKCGSAGKAVTLVDKGPIDYFSGGDVLAAANLVPGGITYATIDNTQLTGAQSNLAWVNINGVAPSNLNAALGTYPFWVEAQFVNNAAATTNPSGGDSTAVKNIISGLQSQATTSALADINVIPNVANAAGTPAKFNTVVHANANLSLANTVYVNPYTRAGVTCNNPVFSANTFP